MSGLTMPVLERAGDRDDLERRARLVDVARRCGSANAESGAPPTSLAFTAGQFAIARTWPVRGIGHEGGRALRLVRLADAAQDLLGLRLDLRVERELHVVPRLHRGRVPDGDRPRRARRARSAARRPCRAAASPALYSRPAPPMPSDFTVPRTCDAEPVARVLAAARRREVDARRSRACGPSRRGPEGTLRARYTKPLRFVSFSQQLVLGDAEDRRELRGGAPAGPSRGTASR